MGHFPFQIRQLPSALQDFASEMENIVEHVFNNGCNSNGCNTNGAEQPATATYRPAIDVIESEAGYELFVDLPGVSPDQVKLELLDDKLHISGTRGELVQNEGTVVHRTERLAGNFVRAIRIPKLVDAERIDAEFNGGVLHVKLPKIPKPTARQIAIRTSN